MWIEEFWTDETDPQRTTVPRHTAGHSVASVAQAHGLKTLPPPSVRSPLHRRKNRQRPKLLTTGDPRKARPNARTALPGTLRSAIGCAGSARRSVQRRRAQGSERPTRALAWALAADVLTTERKIDTSDDTPHSIFNRMAYWIIQLN